jgi:hypothetical protein
LSLLSTRMFMYRFFKKFPQYNYLNTGKSKDCSRIIKEFHNDLINAVTEHRYGVDLPLNMGKIMVVSYKDKPYPNFQYFKQDSTITTFSNRHTDGLKCKIFYTNRERKYRMKDRYNWQFLPETGFRQKVSRAFSDDHTKYVFSPDRKENFNNYLDYKIQEDTERKVKNFLVTYNEFEMN